LKTVLLIGACGSGKTWVMKQIIKEYNLSYNAKIKSIHFKTNKKISVMGKYNNHIFDGTDRLSMSIMKDVNYLKIIQEKNDMIILAEGDRFMNKTFINKFNPYVIKILDDGLIGRKKRNSNQSERQLKSINTRVSNIKHDETVNNSSQALLVIKKIINENT